MTRSSVAVALYAILGLVGCSTCGAPPASPAPATGARLVAPDARLVPRCSACGNDHVCTSTGRCVPDAWHCGPNYYASGDGCDCDCGIPDPDCLAPDPGQAWCYAAGRTTAVSACGACGGAEPALPEVPPNAEDPE